MGSIQRYGRHFLYYNKNSNLLFFGFTRGDKLKKVIKISINSNDDVSVHRTNVYNSVPLGSTDEYIISETNSFERIANLSDYVIINCNERILSKFPEENLKSQSTGSIFNYVNILECVGHKLIRNNYGKFNFRCNVNSSRKYSTARQSTSNVSANDDFETESPILRSVQDDECKSGNLDGDNDVNQYTTRSHTCGELRKSDVGKEVKLCGWVQFIRMDKFILLRDAYGTTQILTKNLVDHGSDFTNLHMESVISVTGTVIPRPESQINARLSTGEIEIEAKSVQILNRALPNMPFLIRDYNKANSKVLNRYRFLALRFPELQNNLRLRSEISSRMRNFLITERKFVEVETPTLFKKTPGGAQEFIVPTQYKNRFYSLVQSPQQLKQLLMVGSVDRYFQIARCYRDEKTNPERQPEFTQLDIELSFTTKENIIKLTEEVIIASWPSSKPPLCAPFPKITYKDALERYGSDKPCLLDQLLIQNLENCVQKNSEQFAYMFTIPQAQAQDSYKQLRQKIDKLESIESTKIYVIKTPTIEKLFQNLLKILPECDIEMFKNSHVVNAGDIIVLSTGSIKENTLKALGSCRHEVIDHLNLLEKSNGEIMYEFTWVVDFPLLEKNELGELKSTHHPFTHPHQEDMHLIPNEAIKARSLAYDLVLNGSEIGGGSIRIHNADLQREIFKILNLEEKDFSHLLEALEMGCPPHGGIALGLDRLFAIICRTESIKDVIAFPKGWEGQDLMTGCPSDVPIADKKRYHIVSKD